MKRLFFFLPFFVLTGIMLFAQIGADTQPVAIVRLSKSQPVSVKEFKDVVNMMSQANSPDPAARRVLSAEDRRKILDTLCETLLACQAAEQERITVSDQQVNALFDEQVAPMRAYLAQRLGRNPTDAELDAELLRQSGMSRPVFKEIMIRRQYVANEYLKVKKESEFKSVKPPTDAEIQKLYNDGKTKSIFEGGFVRPDSIGYKMIRVPVTGAADKARALDKANQLFRQIGGDAGKFDEAIDDSRRPNSGYQGGEGPTLYKHDQVRANLGIDFYDTVFRLKQGEVSKLLERPDGYYIVKVTETLRQKVLTLDDTVPDDWRQQILMASGIDPRDPRAAALPVTVRDYIRITESTKRQLQTYEKVSKDLVAELRKKGSVQVMDSVYNNIVW
jgi:parvulin-like peptidyl-prolyl isomerase